MDHTSDMPADRATCPECGAPAVSGLSCWEQLGLLIAWEADDPALRAEHFLIVASYSLQHPAQLTDEALATLRSGLLERLDNGVAVEELRRRAARQFAGKTRVLRPASDRHAILHQWSTTIADVYVPEHPAGAAERVRGWAAAIRRELT